GGADLPHVLSSIDLFSDLGRDLGTSALVLDTVGHMEGLAVAEHLLLRGAKVTFVSHLTAFAAFAQAANRDCAIDERLQAAGDLTLLLRHELVDIRPGECTVRPVFDLQNRRARTVAADTVVLVTQNQPLR